MLVLRKPFRAAAFACVLLSASPRTSEAQISNRALRDIRIHIIFDPGTGYSNNTQAQNEFRSGARLAMRMWESFFPAMHVSFVPAAEATVTWRVGNYAGFTPPNQNCGVGGSLTVPGWTACSYYPDSNGDVAGGTIFFNTRWSQGATFLHDRFTYFSRQQLYNSYVPATLPPHGYGDPTLGNGVGWVDGHFASARGGEDASQIAFHEFGHTMGLGHEEGISLLPFYGIPRRPDGSQPSTPNILDGRGYANLPQQYYGGGTPTAPWRSDLKPRAVKLHQMALYSQTLPGLPNPMLHWFNFRVVTPDMNNFLGTDLRQRSIYPHSKGLIRLQKESGGQVRLANSWSQAIHQAQLNVDVQNDPFLVTGVFPQAAPAQRIAMGSFHTLAVRNDGSLWAWGRNHAGQLGDGSQTNRTSPVRIGSSNSWIAVAAGEGFSLGLRSDNTLWAWGARDWGQVGDGVFSTTPVLTPKQIGGAEWVGMDVGPGHTLALKVDGTLWGWGYNGYGNLGNGTTNNLSVPTQEIHRTRDWVGVAAGTIHSMGLKADGSLWAWGWNDYGTLGLGHTSSSTVPVVAARGWEDWTLPEAGHEHSMALHENGSLWTWGRNQFQQLGAASSVGMNSLPGTHVVNRWMRATPGHWHNAGIRKDGTLWSWGWNSHGQLGANQPLSSSAATPVREATNATNWNDVFAGVDFTAGLRDDGTLWAWGNNTYGQLGTGGTAPSQNSPVRSLWSDRLPTVSFTWTGTPFARPAVGSTPAANATLTLTAQVTGDVRKVEFWNGSTLIGTRTSAPWSQTWSVGYGSRTVTARAFDGLNASVTSPGQVVHVHELVIFNRGTPAASVSLSTEGTENWKHAGSGNWKSGKHNVAILDVGFPTNSTTQVSSPVFSWSGGTPVGSASNQRSASTATQLHSNYGKVAVLPPTTTARTVKVYFAASGVSTQFRATMDGFNLAESWSNANGVRFFEVRYRTVNNAYLDLSLTSTGLSTGSISLQALTVR